MTGMEITTEVMLRERVRELQQRLKQVHELQQQLEQVQHDYVLQYEHSKSLERILMNIAVLANS